MLLDPPWQLISIEPRYVAVHFFVPWIKLKPCYNFMMNERNIQVFYTTTTIFFITTLNILIQQVTYLLFYLTDASFVGSVEREVEISLSS